MPPVLSSPQSRDLASTELNDDRSITKWIDGDGWMSHNELTNIKASIHDITSTVGLRLQTGNRKRCTFFLCSPNRLFPSFLRNNPRQIISAGNNREFIYESSRSFLLGKTCKIDSDHKRCIPSTSEWEFVKRAMLCAHKGGARKRKVPVNRYLQ